jgi:predicted Fe-Mo cluster-binding NifX family protein
MKIAIAASNDDQNSQVSEQAGRAPYYLIFDEKGKLLEAIKNPFAVGGGGAGFGVAKMLADRGVDLVVAGDFGPNMISALQERNLKSKKMLGTIGDVIKQLI